MFTLSGMARLTPNPVRQRAGKVRVVPQRAVLKMDNKNVLHRVLYIKARGVYEDPYFIVVKVYDEGKKNPVNQRRAWVHCGCAYFKYNCEVALAIQGSSSVINSNGRLPVITNPSQRPYLCKHLYKALQIIPKMKPVAPRTITDVERLVMPLKIPTKKPPIVRRKFGQRKRR